MIARYVGKDKQDYRKGQNYMIRVQEEGNFVLVTSPRFIPYRNWKEFFGEWERVSKA